jgi:hypothetical protein
MRIHSLRCSLFALALFACAGSELPPPSSPTDPVNPRAPEASFDGGPNPFAASVASAAPAADAGAPTHVHSHGDHR